ncbi:Hypothetical predicted protein [Mytilus galloprovincialis]|uniref:Reverse transcriptase zinc-binding domain-containing protein n=1 Tax=Mytilus galloprovincialis TaxID=29158 RepID=A0A8B6GPB7_MYTGA|nr:Hypothetical predicted protein [Mytilus galloprovincialis]
MDISQELLMSNRELDKVRKQENLCEIENRNILETEDNEYGRRKVYSSLFAPMSMNCGTVHNFWANTGLDSISIMKANVKARLLTGVYTLQSNRSRFNKYEVSAICPLCMDEIEDTEHFLLQFASTDTVRNQFIPKLRTLLYDFNHEIGNLVFSNNSVLLRVILDVSSPQVPILIQTFLFMEKIEAVTRGMVYALHHKRCSILDLVGS